MSKASFNFKLLRVIEILFKFIRFIDRIEGVIIRQLIYMIIVLTISQWVLCYPLGRKLISITHQLEGQKIPIVENDFKE